MKTYDLRLDIPARAYINSQLVSLLEMGGSLWDAKKHLFSNEPYRQSFSSDLVYTYKPHDHSLAVSLLYCCIVVPKEILDLPRDHQIYKDFDANDVITSFAIEHPAQVDSHLFIRCLRNSVAHALFSISDQQGEVHYEFWTEREPIFRATIGHKELMRFLSIVGQRLTNTVLAQKSSPDVAQQNPG